MKLRVFTLFLLALLLMSSSPYAAQNAVNFSGDITLKTDPNGLSTGIHFSDGTSQFTGNPLGTNGAGTYYLLGKLGIGTMTPNTPLDVVGDINTSGNLNLLQTSATNGIINMGGAPFIHAYGINNIFVGSNAGNTATTGASNTANGSYALTSNTTGYDNTASGIATLNRNTTGSNNTAVGSNALHQNTTGSYNTACGEYALNSNSSGISNTACGSKALNNNTTGYTNTASGSEALLANTTGYRNTASGFFALGANDSGNSNTAIGFYAGSGRQNGSYNTFVGSGADASADGLTNVTAIGNGAMVDASNHVRIGDVNVTQIGGQVGWSNLSDVRVKDDIVEIKYGLDLIAALRPVQYRLKNGDGRIDFGFIAQDVESLLGDNYNVLGIGGNSERTLSLRYTDFIAPIVKAIQELKEQKDHELSTLKAENDDLKTRLIRLEHLISQK